MQKMIALKNLRFGEEHDPPLNVRKTGREEGIDELAASIDSHGLGQALNIVEEGDLGYVEDGNRRLRALRLLEKRGNLTADSLVKCEVNEKKGVAAGELGLALNVQRVPMHEADQYEQFHRLHAEGKSDKQISQRFGYELKTVRKILAVGKLSPMILDAWRAGKIAFEVVAAFTLAPDLKTQEAVFQRLSKGHGLHAYYVRESLGADSRGMKKLLAFIGDDYKAAGGKIIEDLFGDSRVLSDPALAAKLARQKLEETRDKLRKAGWAWVELADDMPSTDWNFYWQRIGKGEKTGAADKAKSGCVVNVTQDGKLSVVYGLVKPEAKKAAKDGDPQKPALVKIGPPVLSGALEQSLKIMANRATVDALKNEAPASPLTSVLAGVVSAQIDVNTTYHTPSSVDQKLKAIRDAISPAVMDAALKKAFDAERYFKGAPKEFVLKAIKDAIGPEQAKKLAGGTKSAAWKFALENVTKTNWLPPELRTAHYSGPGAPKARATKPNVAKPALKKAA